MFISAKPTILLSNQHFKAISIVDKLFVVIKHITIII